MNILFPSRNNKRSVEIFTEDSAGNTVINGKRFNKLYAKMDRSFIKDFLEENKIFSGYEDKISENMVNKIDNKKTVIMGILNATPDSFYAGSRILDKSRIDSMLDEKPDIIDIGGESTRPGSLPVPPDIETERIRPVIDYIKSVSNIPVSIDSRNYDTIKAVISMDIDYINDISGFSDERMIKIACDYNVRAIVMHMIGTPQTMQNFTEYDDIIFEINNFFYSRINKMLKFGIKPENIIVDPGIGFSKDTNGNITILRSPWSFFLGFDTLFGTSRKRFIGTLTGSDVNDRLGGTIGTSIYLSENGVDILRVHDPAQNRDAINVFRKLTSIDE